MARITSRLLIFTFLLLGLLYLLFHTASYGLTREAQFEALKKKLGSNTEDANEEQHISTPEEELSDEVPVSVPRTTSSYVLGLIRI